MTSNNGQIAGSQDNEIAVPDGLPDGHEQPGMNLNLSVAASPGTPTSSPATSQHVVAHHQTLPQLPGGRPINC